jgi:hypothetical protein
MGGGGSPHPLFSIDWVNYFSFYLVGEKKENPLSPFGDPSLQGWEMEIYCSVI